MSEQGSTVEQRLGEASKKREPMAKFINSISTYTVGPLGILSIISLTEGNYPAAITSLLAAGGAMGAYNKIYEVYENLPEEKKRGVQDKLSKVNEKIIYPASEILMSAIASAVGLGAVWGAGEAMGKELAEGRDVNVVISGVIGGGGAYLAKEGLTGGIAKKIRSSRMKSHQKDLAERLNPKD